MYFLFAYDDYYPYGGMRDYEGAFAEIEHAQKALETHKYSCENGQIVELRDGKLVTILECRRTWDAANDCKVYTWEKPAR